MKNDKTSYSYYFLFFLIGIIFIGTICYSTNTMNHHKYMTVTVQDGDSIWKIASKYEGYTSLSKQSFVEWVEQKNHVYSGKVFPGDNLVIPVSMNKQNKMKINTYASSATLE